MGGCQSRVEVRECERQLDTFDKRVADAASKRSDLLSAETALPVRRRDRSASIALVPYVHEFALNYPSWFPRDEPLQMHFRSVLTDINLVLQNHLEEQMVLNDQMRKFEAGPGYGDAVAAWAMDSRKLKTSTTTAIQRILGAANRSNPHGPRLWGLKGLASIEQEPHDRLEIVFNTPGMAHGMGRPMRPGTASSTSTSGSRSSSRLVGGLRPSGSRADMRDMRGVDARTPRGSKPMNHELMVSGSSSVVEPAHVAVRSGSVSSLRTARTMYDLRGSGSTPSLPSHHGGPGAPGGYRRSPGLRPGPTPRGSGGPMPGTDSSRGVLPSRWGGTAHAAAHARSMRSMTAADDRAEEVRGAEMPSYGRHGNLRSTRSGYGGFSGAPGGGGYVAAGSSARPGPGYSPHVLPRAGVRGNTMGTPPLPSSKKQGSGSSPRSTGSSSSLSSRRTGGIGFVKNYDSRRGSGETAQSASSVSLHREASIPGRY